MIEATLAVGERRRDPVDHYLDPSESKLGPCPEPADRHALAYGWVEPILHLHTWQSLQRISQEKTASAPL